MMSMESYAFYVAAEDGIIYYVDDKLSLKEVVNTECMVKSMYIYKGNLISDFVV